MPNNIYLHDLLIHRPCKQVKGEYVTLLGETFYKISHYDAIPPFFMTIVSDADHWLFISSTGGLTAGRQNADSALFPYYTDDKITENYEHTGSKTILLVEHDEKKKLWEPFSDRFVGVYPLQRNIYKNLFGNVVIFEEINHDLHLTFRYAWRSSDRYGFVRTAWLINTGANPCSIEILDGIQNILPYGATSQIQNTMSNLLDAYKRSELEPSGAIGLFTLSSILTDLAEPSEALRATVAWQIGLDAERYLLSSRQLDRFRQGFELEQEDDIRGRRGAFFVNARLRLEAQDEQEWHIVADVDQEYSDIVSLRNALTHNRKEAAASVLRDIKQGQENLTGIIARTDGLQISEDRLSTAHHLANVLFNTMRGGIFAQGYVVSKTDFLDFLHTRHVGLVASFQEFFDRLPQEFQITELLQRFEQHDSGSGNEMEMDSESDNHDNGLKNGTDSPINNPFHSLIRCSYEYLPLTFSRRHGDPSRPWNTFSINIKKADGSKKLDYQGNWRDIFQNWEPLAYSYPEFAESLICKFLNAVTADGYNPYRVTRDGIEWEVPEPDNPWANIGYWSDHQIIYLQKLLEVSQKFHPGKLNRLLERRIFSHANVPYKIKPYTALLQDWYATIEFDHSLHRKIEELVAQQGTDGKLVSDRAGNVLHVNCAEKLLILLLAKLSNFVPEGGIWMNTQRPEWNDANNALVGKGLSMATVYYLRRFAAFLRDLLNAHESDELSISQEVATWFESIHKTLETYQPLLQSSWTDANRRAMMDELGQAGSAYREQFYHHGFSGRVAVLSRERLVTCFTTVLAYLDQTIRANKRTDGLYHAYNILSPGEHGASVGHLYEMLEGQVAVLSSGLLQAQESLELLRALRTSALYRADQHSYMLYPDRDLPGFLAKNCLSLEQVQDSEIIATLVERGDTRLIARDANGQYHFHGRFRNANDVKAALNSLKNQPEYTELARKESAQILALFEAVFDHQSFTGRSGTFFAYEGLGSIYWHMVSKLLLAVQENVFRACDRSKGKAAISELIEKYYDIRSGLSFHKTPEQYGAFPTDPYSHTPAGQGAKQPGMTGQVKEELLTRFGEMGLFVERGEIVFHPTLLRQQEFLTQAQVFRYIDVNEQAQEITLPAGSLAYTFCQTLVVYFISDAPRIEVFFADGSARDIPGNHLESSICQHIFQRDGLISRICVFSSSDTWQG